MAALAKARAEQALAQHRSQHAWASIKARAGSEPAQAGCRHDTSPRDGGQGVGFSARKSRQRTYWSMAATSRQASSAPTRPFKLMTAASRPAAAARCLSMAAASLPTSATVTRPSMEAASQPAAAPTHSSMAAVAEPTLR